MAIKRIGSTCTGNSIWEFKCDCGKKHLANLNFVKMGKTRSCGCLGIEKHRTHGKRDHWLYNKWHSMMDRCYDKNNSGYHNYGGRGIKVCSRWHDMLNFISDLESYEKGSSIDRINVDGDYCPSNIRFVGKREQSWNMRKNYMVEYNGETRCVAEWAEKKGFKYGTLFSRIAILKWDAVRAIETPINEKFRRKNEP